MAVMTTLIPAARHGLTLLTYGLGMAENALRSKHFLGGAQCYV
jgi:hypothetical protein